jgi:hypothetical protein
MRRQYTIRANGQIREAFRSFLMTTRGLGWLLIARIGPLALRHPCLTVMGGRHVHKTNANTLEVLRMRAFSTPGVPYSV